jgi:hypothetical protein
MSNEENENRRGLMYRALSFLKGSPIGNEERVESNTRRQKYPVIPFYTRYNEFPVLLSMLAEVVPEHDAAIRAKKRWAVPDGFTVTRDNPAAILNNSNSEEPADISDSELSQVEQFLEGVNVDGENLKDLTRRTITDLETVGNGWLELVRVNVKGQRVFFVYHHDATNVLLMRRDDEVTGAICPDWQEVDGFGKSVAPVIELPLYRGRFTEWKRDDKGAERCLLHLKQYRSGRYWYGLPESVAGMLSQKIGFEINRHNLDRLESDFFPRLFFEFYATDGMSEKMQRKHLDKLQETFTKKGDKRFGIFAQYNEGHQSKTQITPLELDHDGDFVPYRQQVRQDILTAHGVHPVIAGVQTPGSLGSSKEIREIFDLFNSTVIGPPQDFIEEQMLTPIMREAGEWTGQWSGLYLTLNTATPVSFFDSINPNKIITVNEGRAKIGLAELQTFDAEGVPQYDPRGDDLIDNNGSVSDNS